MSHVFPLTLAFRALPARQLIPIVRQVTSRLHQRSSQFQSRCASTTNHIRSTRREQLFQKRRAERSLGELWRDYDPEGGLPLPSGELSSRKIATIFGNGVDKEVGNYILAVLHWRRMSGALIDSGIGFPKTSSVTQEQAIIGLEYLRNTYPDVDEEALGSKWIEEEMEKVRTTLQDRAVKLRLYKRDSATVYEAEQEAEQFDDDESLQGTAEGRARTGTSAIEGLRAAIQDRREEKDNARAVELSHKTRTLLHQVRGPLELAGGLQKNASVTRYGTFDVVLREETLPAERPEWVKYWEERATVTNQESAPEMTATRRLLPSFLVTLATVGFGTYLSDQYSPPSTDDRLFPSIPPSIATVGGLSAAIVGTFILCKVPQFWRLTGKYLYIVPGYPYAVSMVGAIFRHDTLSHLATNVVALWVFGPTLHENVGRGTFLAIFLGCGAFGSFTSLTQVVFTRQWSAYIFGSSAAVLGLVAAQCTLRPMATVSVFGYDLPIAAWVFLSAYGLIELYLALRGRGSNIDYFGHLGGLASGTAAGLYLRQKLKKAQEAVMMQETA